ncbi:DUF3604 domain-containing protein [Planctomycetota bacterium]
MAEQKKAGIGLKLGRLGAFGRSALCMGGALTILLLPADRLSLLYLPFQAGQHERVLPAVLILLAVYYLAVSMSPRPRLGLYVGVLDSLLGALHLLFRIGVTGIVPAVAALWIAINTVAAAAMLCGLLMERGEARGLPVRIAAVALSLYLVVSYAMYPAGFVVCWWRQPAVELADLPPAPPFERHTRTINDTRYSVYYGELHGHSYFSIDARLFGARSPTEYYQYARDIAGLDFCALTDHDHPNGLCAYPERWRYDCRVTDEFHSPGKFVTFKAFEWTTGEGHAELVRHWSGRDQQEPSADEPPWGHRNVFFPGSDVPEVPFSHTDADCDTPEELWEKMRPWGAIAIPHHPLGGPVPPMKWERYNQELEPLVEIYSAHGNSESAEARLRIYNAYLAANGTSTHSVKHALGLGYRFGLIGSTDTHMGWGGNGTTYPETAYPRSMIEWVREQYGGEPVKGGGIAGVYARELTREGLFEAFHARRTFGTTGPRIVVALEVAGAFMGSVAMPPRGSKVKLHAEATGTANLASVEVIRDGEVAHAVAGTGEHSAAFDWEDDPVAPEQTVYYYLRVTQEDQEMAWSSPVWVVARP